MASSSTAITTSVRARAMPEEDSAAATAPMRRDVDFKSGVAERDEFFVDELDGADVDAARGLADEEDARIGVDLPGEARVLACHPRHGLPGQRLGHQPAHVLLRVGETRAFRVLGAELQRRALPFHGARAPRPRGLRLLEFPLLIVVFVLFGI